MSYDALLSNASLGTIALPEGKPIRFGGVHMLKYEIPKGVLLISHCHSYDHPSILASGSVELWTSEDDLKTLVGPTEAFIGKGVKHALVALEDSVWYCVHPDNGADPAIEDTH